MNAPASTIFLSYCSKDSEIADLIEGVLLTRLGAGIKISRYTRDVKYRGSFKEFMNTVSKHDFVLCIVSDSYLKSYPCMYEVGETLRNRDYESRLLFFVLDDADKKYYSKVNDSIVADIYTAVGRIGYIRYWENKHEKLRQQINTIRSEDAQLDERERLKNIGKIINYDLPEFMASLGDRRGIPFSDCVATSFESVVTEIDPKAGNIFSSFLEYKSLLYNAIKKVSETTGTDYNQIILRAKTDPHELGLVVFADYIVPNKQKYRITAIDGIISKAIDSGKNINIADTSNEGDYFVAVPSTKSELVVPISIAGRIVGAINSESEKKGYYTPGIVKELEYVSRCLAMQLQKIGYHPSFDYNDIPYVCAYGGKQ